MDLLDLKKELSGNPYPGRGIVIGLSPEGTHAMCAYFIMGRSENSRNRIFEKTADGIRTKAFDESKMEDPSLIIYHPIRTAGEYTIITNGDQTDTIYEEMLKKEKGESFFNALMTRTFEPDPPHFTPRISSMVRTVGGLSFYMSILKSDMGRDGRSVRSFYFYDNPPAGEGRFIHTYAANLDPLPSFEGEPKPVNIASSSPEEFAKLIWDALDSENKVSLYVSATDLKTQETKTVILNKHN